jgi:8-oxo-dGTP diphosphatase
MTTAPGARRWVFCKLGHLHWGAYGGAGLLLRYAPARGEPVYLLAERSRWVDEGGTWGIPGGIVEAGESPEAAAGSQAGEEIWPVPAYAVTEIDVQDCGGGWLFSIVRADADRANPVYAARNTDATGWFTLEQMLTLRLHPGFRDWVDISLR